MRPFTPTTGMETRLFAANLLVFCWSVYSFPARAYRIVIPGSLLREGASPFPKKMGFQQARQICANFALAKMIYTAVITCVLGSGRLLPFQTTKSLHSLQWTVTWSE